MGSKMGRPIVDLQGRTFDQLRVLGFEGLRGPQGNQHAYWRCLCRCGQETVVRGSALTGEKAKSCGCLRAASVRKLNTARRHADPWVAEMNTYVYHVGWEQRRRGSTHKTWDLTLEQYIALVRAPCHYCGEPPGAKPHTRILRATGIKKNGIDRLDSTLGYEPANCVSACGDCNRQKGTMSVPQFIENTRKRFNHLRAKGFYDDEEALPRDEG